MSIHVKPERLKAARCYTDSMKRKVGPDALRIARRQLHLGGLQSHQAARDGGLPGP